MVVGLFPFIPSVQFCNKIWENKKLFQIKAATSSATDISAPRIWQLRQILQVSQALLRPQVSITAAVAIVPSTSVPNTVSTTTIATLVGLNVVAATITNMVAATVGLNVVVATNIIAAAIFTPTRGGAQALNI